MGFFLTWGGGVIALCFFTQPSFQKFKHSKFNLFPNFKKRWMTLNITNYSCTSITLITQILRKATLWHLAPSIQRIVRWYICELLMWSTFLIFRSNLQDVEAFNTNQHVKHSTRRPRFLGTCITIARISNLSIIIEDVKHLHTSKNMVNLYNICTLMKNGD